MRYPRNCGAQNPHRDKENYENIDKNHCDNGIVHGCLKRSFHSDNPDAERRSCYTSDICGSALRLRGRMQNGNCISRRLSASGNCRGSGICGNDGRAFLAGGIQRGIFVGISVSGCTLRRGNSAQASGQPHSVWLCRACRLSLFGHSAVCGCGGRHTSAGVCGGVHAIPCKRCGICGAYLVALPVRKALSAGNILAEEKRPAMGK